MVLKLLGRVPLTTTSCKHHGKKRRTATFGISTVGEAAQEDHHEDAGLANAVKPDELAQRGFGLYEQFRPKIPEGVGGWGAKGELDLGLVRKLAVQK